MDPALLGGLAGFFGALVALGVPLLGFLLRLHSNVQQVLGLVEVRDAVEGDGVLARLRDVEERVGRIETGLAEASGIEYDRSEAGEASQ
jgi:hypothetical protein